MRNRLALDACWPGDQVVSHYVREDIVVQGIVFGVDVALRGKETAC